MMIKKERNGKESVIVVLDGIKASKEKYGVAPLVRALRDLVDSNDEVLVLAILNSEAPTPSPNNASYCCLGERRNTNPPTQGGDSYISFLHEEISQRKEGYKKILRPYYDSCKTNGVKFQVKIAAGFEPKATIIDEANNAKATWIVMDSCFAGDQSFLLSEANCNISFVGEDEEALAQSHVPSSDEPESSSTKELKPNSKCSSRDKKVLQKADFDCKQQFSCPSCDLASTSREAEILTMFDPSEELKTKDPINVSFTKFSEANLVLRQPLQLSWEMILEISRGFQSIISTDHNGNSKLYSGILDDGHSCVLVRRFNGSFTEILEAEKKTALCIYHKNILGLLSYHKSKYETILVFPCPPRGTLDKFLCGLKGKQAELEFQEKMKIAMGIAQGVRYMHEECPRGPIVHSDLRPSNIFLTDDFEPLITGFERATWLQPQRPSPIFLDRFSHNDPSEVETSALVKSDIFSFGILLLRLFCKRSAPQDDNKLLDWARPFLQQRAYYKLLDEDTEVLDTYGIYSLMFVAGECTKIKPLSRPCMSEVICYLRGEISCAVESSPSSDGSPNLDFNVRLT